PIGTVVPGIQVCELLPKLACCMDKLVLVRTLVGTVNQHEPDQCLSGWPSVNGLLQGGHPSLGSVVSYLQGPVDRAIPPFVYVTGDPHPAPVNPGQPGFLGGAYSAFRPASDGPANLTLQGISLERLRDRRALRRSLDSFRRELHSYAAVERLDGF